jgi:N utilization substance protein B
VGRRHHARELALKVLFELENGSADAQPVLQYHAAEDEIPPEVTQFAGQLVDGVRRHRQELDRVISEASRNWSLEQMAKVDRIILRIAIYEMLISRNVPVKAAINESIELAKTFSGEEAGRFVNGVLGKVAAGTRQS